MTNMTDAELLDLLEERLGERGFDHPDDIADMFYSEISEILMTSEPGGRFTRGWVKI